jgi:methyl-accepting chemotaxis protein
MATKFVTGLAKGAVSIDVGKEAAKMALQKLGGSKVNLSVVFSSPKYNYQEVIKGIREITNNAPLIGCSSAGEFTEEGVQSGSVVCALLSSDTHKFFTGIGKGLREDETSCVREAAKSLPMFVENYPYQSYILCVDGLAGKGEETALAMLSTLGTNMKFAGGSAGDDLKMLETISFADDKALTDAVSLALIASKKPLIIAVRHGHMPISPPLTITKSEANIVYEIDGKPAFEVWKKYAGEDAKKSMNIDVNKLQEGSTDLTRFFTYYEAGLYVDETNYKIRWCGTTTATNGPIKFTTSMPEGIVLRVMASPKENQIASARRSAEMVMENLRGVKLAGAVIFDCVVRGVILQDEFHKAIEAIKEVLKVPFVGLETYGEFALEAGQMSGFHNTTTVILAIPD